MHRSALSIGLFLGTFSLAAACGSSDDRLDFDTPADGGNHTATTGDGAANPPSLTTGDSGAPLNEPGKTTLQGITYAPNGTLPLAGVLVYETDTPPAAIPATTYCDSCRVLPEGTFVQSASDGTFSFHAHAGTRYLVTEKGQFRRVRKIVVGADGTVQDVDHEITTLPGKTAAGTAGEDDTAARIALMAVQSGGDNDAIQQALLALGITEWDNFDEDLGKVTAANLSNYHVAMFPCDGTSLHKPGSSENEALRTFVQAGGKVYASDWSHQFVDGPFAEFFEHPNRVWNADTGAQAPAGRYDDPDLAAWLGKVSPGEDPAATTFEGVWSTYLGVKPATVPDTAGGTHQVTPHLYASITDDDSLYYSSEAATSMEFGCGRALLSTFHVHGGNTGSLLMQEKALLYMLLDVSTCIGEPGRGVVN